MGGGNSNSLHRTIFTQNSNVANNRFSPSNILIINHSPQQQHQQHRIKTFTLPSYNSNSNSNNNSYSTPTSNNSNNTNNESNINSDALPTVQERIEQFQSISRQQSHQSAAASANLKPSQSASIPTTPQQNVLLNNNNKGQIMFNKLNSSINDQQSASNNTNNNTINNKESPRIVRILTTPNTVHVNEPSSLHRQLNVSSNYSPQANLIRQTPGVAVSKGKLNKK